jgi:hypothetical protein
VHCPDGFNNNTIIILSRHVQNGYLSFEEKFNSLKNIKKIFIDELGMKVATKLHPNEKKEKTFSNSKDKIYENVFGLKNYGSTWVYSDLHIFALCNEKNLLLV